MIGGALDAFGRIDAVVNNAGILRDGIFHKMSHADFEAVLDVHLRGSFNASRAAADHFREQGSGAFVHFTSTSGLIGNVGQANYAAAKMGIVGLSRGIALDMARFGVRSNCIAPFAWSRMIGSIPTETEDQKARVEKLKSLTPDKIAPMAVFLASEAASRGDRPDLLRARQRGLPDEPAASAALAAPRRRLDAPGAGRPDAAGVQERPLRSRCLGRCLLLGPGVSAPDAPAGPGQAAGDGRGAQGHDHRSRRGRRIRHPVLLRFLAARDAMLYALGWVWVTIRLTGTSCLSSGREWVPKVLPSFVTVIGDDNDWLHDPALGLGDAPNVHGDQTITLHRPIPAEGGVRSQSRIVGLCDRGPGSHAILVIEEEVIDEASGGLLATLRQTDVLIGAGGFRRRTAAEGLERAAPAGPRPRRCARAARRRPRRRCSTGCPATTTSSMSSRSSRVKRASTGRSCMGWRPMASPVTRSSPAAAIMIPPASRASMAASPRRSIRARRCETRMWRDGCGRRLFETRAAGRDVVVLGNGRADLKG